MTKVVDKKIRQKKRKRRSNPIKGSSERPRVVFCKSNRYLRVQAIDDIVGNTIAFASTEDFKGESKSYSCKNKDYAKKLGELFANKLKKEGITKIIFDRNGYPYIFKKSYVINQVRGGAVKKVVNKAGSGKI